PLKNSWKNETSSWAFKNPGKKINRYNYGQILYKSWLLAATAQNGISGFKSCGIYPFNKEKVPEDAYTISDMAESINLCNNNQDFEIIEKNELPALHQQDTLTSFEDILPIPKINKPSSSRKKQSSQILTDTNFCQEKWIKFGEKISKSLGKRKENNFVDFDFDIESFINTEFQNNN
ncbi:hypothetical protein BB559_005989, partial [Furculomyces boomerangus]